VSGDDRSSRDLPAGAFGDWLDGMRAALRHEADADVACGDCCACCSTGHFVHIAPEETETLAHIAPELVFPAPGQPAGHVLLGHDERGRCPLLDEGGRCTVYAWRPRTCRIYDCRVFAAAGIAADRAAISARARRWRFACPAPADADKLAAARAAARFVREHAAAFPGGAVPDDPSQLAVLAVRVADVFLPGGVGQDGSDPKSIADAVVHASRATVP
jgi:uncharacterized protein